MFATDLERANFYSTAQQRWPAVLPFNLMKISKVCA